MYKMNISCFFLFWVFITLQSIQISFYGIAAYIIKDTSTENFIILASCSTAAGMMFAILGGIQYSLIARICSMGNETIGFALTMGLYSSNVMISSTVSYFFVTFNFFFIFFPQCTRLSNYLKCEYEIFRTLHYLSVSNFF